MNFAEKSIAIALLVFSAFAAAHGRLGAVMKELKKDYKMVNTELSTGSISDTLLTVAARMKRSAAEARTLVPHKIAAIRDAAIRAEALRAYQSTLDELIAELDHLQSALTDRDLTKARESLKRVKAIEDRGHDQFD